MTKCKHGVPHYCETCTIERLHARVAELQTKVDDFQTEHKAIVEAIGIGKAGTHVITTEQINEMWAQHGDGYCHELEAALSIIGVIECEECGGSGCWSSTSGVKCPRCKGKKWRFRDA